MRRNGGLSLLLAASLALWALPASAQSCDPAATTTKYPSLAGKTIKVGVQPAEPPTLFRDPSDPNKIIGVHAELAEATFACLGLKHEFVAMDFAGLIPAVTSGRVDVQWSGMYYTPERARQVNYVTYYTNPVGALVVKGNPKGLTSMEAVCGARVAAITGSVDERLTRVQSEKCVAARRNPVEITVYPDAPATARAVENDRSDVAMFSLQAVNDQVRRNPARLERGFFFNADLLVGASVRKENRELLEAIEAAMKQVQVSGKMQAILSKYGMDPAVELPVEIKTQ